MVRVQLVAVVSEDRQLDVWGFHPHPCDMYIFRLNQNTWTTHEITNINITDPNSISERLSEMILNVFNRNYDLCGATVKSLPEDPANVTIIAGVKIPCFHLHGYNMMFVSAHVIKSISSYANPEWNVQELMANIKKDPICFSNLTNSYRGGLHNVFVFDRDIDKKIFVNRHMPVVECYVDEDTHRAFYLWRYL